MTAHIFPILFGRNPHGLLDESDGLIIAAAAHRVDDDDVRHVAVGLHHEAQPHCALNLAFFGCVGEFQVVGDIFSHVAAVGEVGLGHFVQLLVFVDVIRGVGF